MKALKARQFFEDVRKLHSPDASCFGTDSAKPTLEKREANATHPEFRDELLRLAALPNSVSPPSDK